MSPPLAPPPARVTSVTGLRATAKAESLERRERNGPCLRGRGPGGRREPSQAGGKDMWRRREGPSYERQGREELLRSLHGWWCETGGGSCPGGRARQGDVLGSGSTRPGNAKGGPRGRELLVSNHTGAVAHSLAGARCLEYMRRLALLTPSPAANLGPSRAFLGEHPAGYSVRRSKAPPQSGSIPGPRRDPRLPAQPPHLSRPPPAPPLGQVPVAPSLASLLEPDSRRGEGAQGARVFPATYPTPAPQICPPPRAAHFTLGPQGALMPLAASRGLRAAAARGSRPGRAPGPPRSGTGVNALIRQLASGIQRAFQNRGSVR